MELVKVIQSNNCSIVDVRTPSEFQGGHVAGSVNVPLQELTGRLAEISEMKAPIVFCCASGGRSAQATQMLKTMGIECYDGGPWTNVNAIQSRANQN